MVKTPRERQILTNAYQAHREGVPGDLRHDPARRQRAAMSSVFAENILLSGADSVAFNHINAGPNTGFRICRPPLTAWRSATSSRPIVAASTANIIPISVVLRTWAAHDRRSLDLEPVTRNPPYRRRYAPPWQYRPHALRRRPRNCSSKPASNSPIPITAMASGCWCTSVRCINAFEASLSSPA